MYSASPQNASAASGQPDIGESSPSASAYGSAHSEARGRLLVVSTLPIWPIREGFTLRAYNLLEYLVREWDVVLVAPEEGERPAWATGLDVRPVHLAGKWRVFPWQYDAATLERHVAGILDTSPAFDAALLWTGAEHLAQVLAGRLPPAVSDRVDCSTLTAARSFRTARGVRERFGAVRLLAESARYERQLVRAARRTVVVGNADARALRWISGRSAVDVITNGVTVPPKPAQGESDVATAIFTGVLSYPPNIDAVRFFVQEVWPLVRASVPAARFIAAGRQPTAEVHRLAAAADGVEIMADVPDMAQMLAKAWVAVAPMQSGSGVKNKVLEAWACGKPVVMTTMATNGLELPPWAADCVADSPRAFAKRVAELLVDPERRHAVGANAAGYARDRYSWSRVGGELSRLLQRVARESRAGAPATSR